MFCEFSQEQREKERRGEGEREGRKKDRRKNGSLLFTSARRLKADACMHLMQVWDENGKCLASHQIELIAQYPESGYV